VDGGARTHVDARTRLANRLFEIQPSRGGRHTCTPKYNKLKLK
jgi:hypothetical protein